MQAHLRVVMSWAQLQRRSIPPDHADLKLQTARPPPFGPISTTYSRARRASGGSRDPPQVFCHHPACAACFAARASCSVCRPTYGDRWHADHRPCAECAASRTSCDRMVALGHVTDLDSKIGKAKDIIPGRHLRGRTFVPKPRTDRLGRPCSRARARARLPVLDGDVRKTARKSVPSSGPSAGSARCAV